jgi:hypothetical protein
MEISGDETTYERGDNYEGDVFFGGALVGPIFLSPVLSG